MNTIPPQIQDWLATIPMWGVMGILLSVICTAGAVLLFPKIGLLDFPHRYNLKREKLPYPGGLGILLCSLVLVCIDVRFLPMVVGALILGAVSFWDDRHQVSAYLRLALHLAVAAGVWLVGVRINFIGNPFAETNLYVAQWPLISFGLTVIWIVAIQNAMNWFDGIRGLAVGVSGVGFLVLGLLGLFRQELFFDLSHSTVTTANLFFAAVCLTSFWWYWKGKLLLGDTGSQVLGFLLATMAIASGAKIATTLLVLGLPLVDFGLVIARRVLIEKKSPFKGDLQHVHHNLAQKVGEKYAALILVGISLALGLISLLFVGMTKMLALGLALLCIFAFIVWTGKNEDKNLQ